MRLSTSTNSRGQERRFLRVVTDEKLRCSFCRQRQSASRQLISSSDERPRVYICDKCVVVCNSIVKNSAEGRVEAAKSKPLLSAELRCSFCHKSQVAVRKLIQSPDKPAYIGNKCATACQVIWQEGPAQPRPEDRRRIGNALRKGRRELWTGAFRCVPTRRENTA